MIRSATSDDIPAIVQHLYALHAEAPEYMDCVEDEEYVIENLYSYIASDQIILLIDDEHKGFILGHVGRPWYDPRPLAYEQLLYVHENYRGGILAARLIKEFVCEADRRGAHAVMAGASTGINDNMTRRLYMKLGFEPKAGALRKKLK